MERQHWRKKEWEKYICSDECSVERGRGKAWEWVFCTSQDRYALPNVQTYKKSRDLSIMVWGCFWGAGRSELYILDRDFESAKFEYSANSYLEVLEDQIPKCWIPGLQFMQDNAPIHKAKKVKWFKDMAIPLIDWPPYSPDLNPIEHIWVHLKRKVMEIHPEYIEWVGNGEDDIRRLEIAIVEAWDALPKSLFDSLIEKYEKRVAAFIKAKGLHTKY